ncbi:MAG: DNA cytosine methyltransferase, partial [Candidatus Hodarchaeales archaeon]
MKNLEILDLYCGAGGFSFGFSEANPGFNIRLAIDNNEWAVQTFRQNHPSSQVIKADITKIHSLDILEMLNGKEPDIIIASPPCEAFSSANANRRKNDYDRLYSDETGRNLLHTIRIIKNLSPKFFFIKQEFKGSGYKKIHFNMENALKYGIASFRKRVFISNIALPSNMSLKKKVTIRAAFKGLPDPFSFHSLKNHEILFPNRKMAKKIPKMKSNTALVYFQGSQKKSYRNYVKLPLNTFAPTVMGKSRFIHPLEHRLCTVREHARLMSYPDHFEFKGPQVWQF